MTENQLRQKVADIINAWVGATKGSAKHLEILEIYNGHKPLARGYRKQLLWHLPGVPYSLFQVKVLFLKTDSTLIP